MIEVSLTRLEMAMAADCAAWRNINSIFAGSEPAYGCETDENWRVHMEGTCGEVAAAKALDRFWSPRVNTYHHVADIGDDIQVRTRSEHEYELIIRPRDLQTNPEHKYIHVTGRAPNFVVRGYIIGKDAEHPEWWHNHGGRPFAWFVPETSLLDIEELRR